VKDSYWYCWTTCRSYLQG